tara:strand:+ start:128 stop:469 length:342 start_codon:yes stop_codon:yes gene_type:complete
MKITTVKNKAAEIMTLKPETRDNDFYLMYWIWRDEYEALDLVDNTKLDFNRANILSVLSLLKDRRLSHPSGIMRARRKLQEDYPKLRGEIWKERHAEQSNVQADLGYVRKNMQ